MRLDTEATDAFVQEAVGHLEGGTRTLSVDMTRVGYASPRTLAALDTVCRAAVAAGATVELSGVQSPVYKALHMAGLGTLLRRA